MQDQAIIGSIDTVRRHLEYDSYNKLANFKATIINEFFLYIEINSVIEYGCGDGNYFKFAEYPFYIVFDVSSAALSVCKLVFQTMAQRTSSR